MKPTTEQSLAIDAFATGDNITVEAGAGTGKTSTLKLMSAAEPNRRILYLAYNASIARESAASFPENCECRTAHSVAYRWTAAKWGGAALRSRLQAPRMPGRELARRLRSDSPLRVSDELVLSPERVATIAMQTVQRWCHSASATIEHYHVPDIPRIQEAGRVELIDAVLPMAKAAWLDLSRSDGTLRFQHDHYLKLWALSSPRLAFDAVLVDEAQDSNGVITGVIQDQTCQVAAVGDRHQQIYGWRGATDAMDAFDSQHHVYLTMSFRFGQDIADEANKWLSFMGSKMRLSGNPSVQSQIEETADPRAILCRTNAEAITQVMRAHSAGRRVALVGDGKDIVALARAAKELQTTGRTSHHELFVFTSWDMVREYVEDSYDGSDLAVMVKLIDEHGADGVIRAVEGCTDESAADLTVSTAHKSKGREWSSVKIADDFNNPPEDVEESIEGFGAEAMLAYVAITRARDVLDRTGLKWIDDFAVVGA